jgi:hypothetical protein
MRGGSTATPTQPHLANVAVALGRTTVAPNPSPDAVTAVEVPVEVGTGLRQAVQRWQWTAAGRPISGVDEDLPSASYAGLYTKC